MKNTTTVLLSPSRFPGDLSSVGPDLACGHQYCHLAYWKARTMSSSTPSGASPRILFVAAVKTSWCGVRGSSLKTMPALMIDRHVNLPSLSALPLSTYMPISLPPLSLSLHISPSPFLRSPFLPPSLAHCSRQRGQTFCRVLIISKDHCSPTFIAQASLPPTRSS